MLKLRLLVAPVLLTTIMLATNSPTPVAAAGNQSAVVVSLIAPATVAQGSYFTAYVNISEVASLDATGFRITFNPAVIALNSVTPGAIGPTAVPVTHANTTNSSAVIVVQKITGTTGLSGSGTLAKLQFLVVGTPGQISPIRFFTGTLNGVEYGVLSDSQAAAISGTWNDTAVTVTSAPPVGGGGGGGGGFRTITTTGLSGTAPTANGAGSNMVNASLVSDDQKATLSIPQGTVMLNAAGNPLGSITCSKPPSLPAAPANSVVIGGYDFGPDGATFTPPITLTLTFNQADIPPGTDAANLKIGFWDGTGWQILSASLVNPQTNEISVAVSHFTNYAIIGPKVTPAAPSPSPSPPPAATPVTPVPTPAAPASFSASNLKISPAEVIANAAVEIQTLILNTGGSQGICAVILTINNIEAGRQEISLSPGESKTVAFTIQEDSPGKYVVDVNGNTGEFTVRTSQLSVPLAASGTGSATTVWPLLIVGGAALVIVLMAFSINVVRKRRK